MGFLGKLRNPWRAYAKAPKWVVELVLGTENGEEWAFQKIKKLEARGRALTYDEIAMARIEIFGPAAAQGDAGALKKTALALSRFDARESYDVFMELVDRGDTEAMKDVAQQYAEYGCYGKNDNERMKWLRRAAKAGDAEAQTKTAQEYFMLGDKRAAEHWYRKAAAQDNYSGMLGLADMLSSKQSLCEDAQQREALRDEEEGLLVDAFNIVAENPTGTDEALAECAKALAYYYRRNSILTEALFYFAFAQEVDPDLAPYMQENVRELEQQMHPDEVAEVYGRVDSAFG